MEQRPRSTIGLAAHLVRLRWQQLSARGRMVASIAIAVAALAGLAGAHRALGGGCCHGSCPASGGGVEQAAMDVDPAVPEAVDGQDGEHEGCGAAH